VSVLRHCADIADVASRYQGGRRPKEVMPKNIADLASSTVRICEGVLAGSEKPAPLHPFIERFIKKTREVLNVIGESHCATLERALADPAGRMIHVISVTIQGAIEEGVFGSLGQLERPIKTKRWHEIASSPSGPVSGGSTKGGVSFVGRNPTWKEWQKLSDPGRENVDRRLQKDNTAWISRQIATRGGDSSKFSDIVVIGGKLVDCSLQGYNGPHEALGAYAREYGVVPFHFDFNDYQVG